MYYSGDSAKAVLRHPALFGVVRFCNSIGTFRTSQPVRGFRLSTIAVSMSLANRHLGPSIMGRRGGTIFEARAENICEAPGDRQGVESASLLR